MGTKEQLLELFENNKGEFLSGEEIAKQLSVSRSAVWKAVKALRDKGYKIEAVSNRGYSLTLDTDILSVQGIRKYLSGLCSDMDIQVYPELVSTNTAVRERAADGAQEGLVVIANSQSGGRGRFGRNFYSPSDTGLYMSLLVRPSHCPAKDAVKLTTLAAVAVCEAIEAVSGEKAEIKWVNDVYIAGKKVCGILTEASFSMEDGFLEYAVIGIGTNVFAPKDGFPKELKDIAGAVFQTPRSDGKNHLAAEILNRFMLYYKTDKKQNYGENYRRRSFVIGKDINVCLADNIRKARALDVDEECRLVVQYENGETDRLSSGEISIRIQR